MRRILTIVGWSAGVCLVVYLVFVGMLYIAFDDSETAGADEALDVVGPAIFWLLFASPFIGGIIGVVRAVRGATVGTKVAWSSIGLVLMTVSWFALAAAGIWILDHLPGLD